MIKKEQIQSFDAGFCSRETLLSEAIQAGTQSQFSHTAHFVWEGDELMVYDAQIDGYHPKRFEDWIQKYQYNYIVMRNPDIDFNFINGCITNTEKISGKPYDKFSLLVRKPFNIVRSVANVFRKKNKDAWKPSPKKQLDRVFCSEATAYVMQRPNIDLTPNELFTDLTLQGWKVVK